MSAKKSTHDEIEVEVELEEDTPPAPPTKPTPAPARSYRVKSAGISAVMGPAFAGAILTADQVGDTDRVAKLLQRGSIEEVTHAADGTAV